MIGLSNNDVISLRSLRPLSQFRYVPYVVLDGNHAQGMYKANKLNWTELQYVNAVQFVSAALHEL